MYLHLNTGISLQLLIWWRQLHQPKQEVNCKPNSRRKTYCSFQHLIWFTCILLQSMIIIIWPQKMSTNHLNIPDKAHHKCILSPMTHFIFFTLIHIGNAIYYTAGGRRAENSQGYGSWSCCLNPCVTCHMTVKSQLKSHWFYKILQLYCAAHGINVHQRQKLKKNKTFQIVKFSGVYTKVKVFTGVADVVIVLA